MSRKLVAAFAFIAAASLPADGAAAQGGPAVAVAPSVESAQAAASREAASGATAAAGAVEGEGSYRALLDRYCVTCHNAGLATGRGGAPSPLVSQLRAVGLALDTLELSSIDEHPEEWEKVVRKLRGGMMPPAGRPRPNEEVAIEFVAWLEDQLDGAAAERPDPGRTAPLHRLNRAEYRNAVRDLLALEVDVDGLLPADDSSYGFDNIATALRMSQSLLERYLAAARTVSRLAVGSPPPAVVGETYRLATDIQQHDRMDGLPFGTRGGVLVTHLFPREAEYDIQVELGRARNVSVTHRLEIAVDGEQVETVTLAPPDAGAGGSNSYANASSVAVRVPVPAGPHEVGVTFHRNPAALVEQVRLPFQNPRRGGAAGPIPIVSTVTIAGPYNPQGAGETPSRSRIFTCRPVGTAADDEARCASRILSSLARVAYRRPVTDDDLDTLLGFYRDERAAGGSFEGGIELALRWLLASPDFLFRVEAAPSELADADVYRISDLELASRLSFFLWSSIPDDELLRVAEAGRLGDPAELERQVRRMLADPRAGALTANFAGQWLQLRNLADTAVRPGDPYSLAFDESLRRGMIRETERFFDSIVRENRPALDLLTADYTFLNERVAMHYGVPNVQGSRFRRVPLPAGSPRRGLLGHGSILTLTSHAIRTSPVLRGKWILNNILGTPPPDPPPNVPALVDRKTQAKTATLRERMQAHRDNPACAACHAMIDPAGFALENFDAIGRWRVVDESFNPIDASGVLPDGTAFDGVGELRAALVRRPERFVTTMTEKLLTYALGRGLTHADMPAVRRILRETADGGYRLQSIILSVVRSDPFQLRRARS